MYQVEFKSTLFMHNLTTGVKVNMRGCLSRKSTKMLFIGQIAYISVRGGGEVAVSIKREYRASEEGPVQYSKEGDKDSMESKVVRKTPLGEGAHEKKSISWKNLAIGATIQVFEVSTLGQPFEVLKTHMAGNSNNRYPMVKIYSSSSW